MYENNARHGGEGMRAFEFHKLGEGWDGTRARGWAREARFRNLRFLSNDLLILRGFQPRDHVLFAMRFAHTFVKPLFYRREDKISLIRNYGIRVIVFTIINAVIIFVISLCYKNCGGECFVCALLRLKFRKKETCI